MKFLLSGLFFGLSMLVALLTLPSFDNKNVIFAKPDNFVNSLCEKYPAGSRALLPDAEGQGSYCAQCTVVYLSRSYASRQSNYHRYWWTKDVYDNSFSCGDCNATGEQGACVGPKNYSGEIEGVGCKFINVPSVGEAGKSVHWQLYINNYYKQVWNENDQATQGLFVKGDKPNLSGNCSKMVGYAGSGQVSGRTFKGSFVLGSSGSCTISAVVTNGQGEEQTCSATVQIEKKATPIPTRVPTVTNAPSATPIPTVISTVGQTSLYFPVSTTEGYNANFTVPLKIDTGVDKITAVDLNLVFDPQKISLLKILPSSSLPKVILPVNIDNSRGTLRVVLGVNPGKEINGNGLLLLTIYGKTKTKEGNTQIAFSQKTLVSSLTSSGNVLRATRPLQIKINSLVGNLLADLNGDKKVDINDVTILVNNMGKIGCGNVADINSDCKVDILDYNILAENFKKHFQGL